MLILWLDENEIPFCKEIVVVFNFFVIFVRLSNCKLGLELSRALAVLLIDNPRHLRELDVSMNDLGDRGVELLMDILKSTQIYKLE